MKALARAVLVLALAACGYGEGTNALPRSSFGEPQDALNAKASATLLVSIVIPETTTATDFISPGTQSLVVVEGNYTVLGTFNTLRTSRGCKRSHSNVLCRFSMSAQTGRQMLSFRTYSRKSGKGYLLAKSRVFKRIRSGSNSIALSLRGITGSIVVGLSEAQPLIGKPAVIDVIVTALDASGAVITGKYSTAIKLTDSDTSGATHLSRKKTGNSAKELTLAYNGSGAVSAAVIGATAAGVNDANSTPATLRPTTTAGETISGTAAFSVVSDASGNVAAYIPINGAASADPGGVIIVPIAKNGVIAQETRAPRALRPAALQLTPAPDECAPDIVHAQLYCISFGSNVVNVAGYEPSNVLSPLKLLGSTTTDAPLAGVSFSGATCIICGIAFDPNDDAFIIATAKGYELWPVAPGATVPMKTLPAPISENFGYNALTNQIFSAWYGTDNFDGRLSGYTYSSGFSGAGLDVIDVASSNRYVLATPSPPLNEPDAAAVDTHTNIGIAPEENFTNGAYPVVYIDDLRQPPATFAAPTPVPSPLPSGLPPYQHGAYASPVVVATPSSMLLANANEVDGCNLTYTAVDSVKDLAFFGEEYCNSDYVAVAQLPTTSSGTLGFSNYVAAELPATLHGAFASPLDPHAILVDTLSGICEDCGILFNYDKSYVAIVDLNKLIALNPGGGEKDVPTTDTLKGIVIYIPTGDSSPPSYYVRKLALAHRMKRRGALSGAGAAKSKGRT
ncbi:MAG TPA: hypothetical protein VFE36_09850 [Candidatus Baltobacteraceae bacterium]|nr:hypothetical protein [Candidatus Baltobacteraceae bacterium]